MSPLEQLVRDLHNICQKQAVHTNPAEEREGRPGSSVTDTWHFNTYLLTPDGKLQRVSVNIAAFGA